MIRPGITRALAAGAILTTAASAGHAEAPQIQASYVIVQSGSHPGFGRIAINTHGKNTYQLDQDGDHVVVRLTGDVTLGKSSARPRNVIAMQTDGSSLELTLKHDATVRAKRTSGGVVLDIMDPKREVAPPPTVRLSKIPPEPRPLSPPPMATPLEMGGRPAPASAPGASTTSAPGAAAPQPLLSSPRAQPSPARPPAGLPPPTPSPPAPSPPTPSPAVPSAAVPSAAIPSPAIPSPAIPSPATQSVPQATQQTPPGRDVLPENEAPVGLMARRVTLPKDMDGSAFRVPFDSTTGAAAFRRGDSAYIVFAERRPVDMSALRDDPVFSAATVRLLPDGTLFRVPLPSNRWIALTPMQQGWRIATLTTELKQQPIAVSYMKGSLSLEAERPGDVVSLADPDTGATLLVGTQHRPGQGVAASQRSSEFILRPTIQGVVVEALSDAIALRQVPTGFSLDGGAGGLMLSPPTSVMDALMDAAHLTRRFDFSSLPADVVLRRATAQIAAAAASPPLARGRKNHLAAESLMALGLNAEAESLFHLAAEQDPKEAASADTGGLAAIAALLAGREEDADALMDPRLDGTDDISLWRAVRKAMQDDGSPSAAAVFSATAPLVFVYPKPIRDHILPLMIETMIKGGEITPAARLLEQRQNDPRLAYARALMRQTEGDTDQALGMLDALTNGHDQFDRARAASRAVELRLAAGKLDKVRAADALDKLLYAWRGDARELALRERVAELRGQSGAWRIALGLLRQAKLDFPEQARPIHQRLKDMFAAMIRDPAEQQGSAIDFVAMVDENTDLIPDAGDDDQAVQQALATRLLALDLPDRAEPVLEKLMRLAKSDVAKARFGTSLATLESRDGNDAGAEAVLDRSEGRDLPPEVTEQRMILRAGAVAHLGNAVAGAAMLAPFHSSRATQARAQILENASDWAGAEQAWSDCVALTFPGAGLLDDAQTRTVLRLATATARAGDNTGLTALRAKYGNRIGAGPLADMFRLLTAAPIRTSADIKRSQQEVSLAASLSGDLKALQTGAVTR